MTRSMGKSEAARADLATALILLIATWLGVNAVWGLTSSEPTLVSAWQAGILRLELWAGGVALLLAAVLAFAGLSRRRRLTLVAATLLAYHTGVWAGELLRDVAQATWLAHLHGELARLLDRAFVLVPALPMLIVAWLLSEGFDRYPLRWGKWRPEPGKAGAGRQGARWDRRLILWMVAVFLPLALLMQGSVDFAPLRTGLLWPALAPLTLLALLNAFTEELLFRGLILPPLVRLVGLQPGLWLQGLFFGFHHWGASPDPIAALPNAIILTLVGYFWGKSVLETGGLGWAVVTHMSLDCALFWAHFVPTS